MSTRREVTIRNAYFMRVKINEQYILQRRAKKCTELAVQGQSREKNTLRARINNIHNL